MKLSNYKAHHEFKIVSESDWQDETEISYIIQLPHQCDSWEISRNTDKEIVLKEMDHFIAAAIEARMRFKDGKIDEEY